LLSESEVTESESAGYESKSKSSPFESEIRNRDSSPTRVCCLTWVLYHWRLHNYITLCRMSKCAIIIGILCGFYVGRSTDMYMTVWTPEDCYSKISFAGRLL